MSEPLGEQSNQLDEESLEDFESPNEAGLGLEVTTAEGDGSTFEPEEDPEAAR